ncbi:phenylalanine--tRNA ligase subunit beta [Malacoplasma muris]|uniref:phenylalanine--tRNA ligase subunit beta n=1 Tax=Malacoplasma muris TaxID=2119 RepID=UPI00398E3D18
MLLSRKLLENFFPIFKQIKNSDIEKTLLLMGCEIENKYTFDKVNNLIVGLITETKKHPKSNKLNLCTVEVNNKKRTIVCGADNVKPGAKVIVALEGAKMVDGRVIQYKELLGIVSEGMICAYNELTLNTEYISDIDKDNIIILDDNAKLNDTDPLKYIHFDDTIYDVSIPSNRNELNGVIGLAHDLLHILKPNYNFDYSFNFSGIKKNKIKLNINKENAPFFGTIEMSNMMPTESSWTVKSYLMNSGVRPVNSIVDISNLVMILGGTPAHSYDKDKIGNTFSVEKLKSDKKYIALDSKEYLTPKCSLIVKTDNKDVCVAGIIGLQNSSITNSTKNVIFEIANFNNLDIANSSRKMKIKTDASVLNSKKIPMWIRIKSFETMINLLQSSKSKFEGISFTPFKLSNTKIKFNYKQIVSLLGIKMSESDVKKHLKHLGFEFSNNYILPPIYREDVTTIYDVIEELLKIIDVNKMELNPIDSTFVNPLLNNYEYKNIVKTNNFFIHNGYSLVKTYNLTSEENNKKYNIFNAKKFYEIINPISKDKQFLRSSIIGQLLNVYSYNQAHKNDLIPIFELQKLNYDLKETYHLSLLLRDKIYFNSINKSFVKVDIFYLKSLIIDFFKNFNQKITFKDNFDIYSTTFLKLNSLAICDDKNVIIGYLGQINPNYVNDCKIDQPLFFIEVKINELIKKEVETNFIIEKITSTTHSIVRSLSIILTNQNVTSLINSLEKNDDIESYKIIDVFKINENEISYNVQFVIKKNSEKMSQDEINIRFNRIIDFFEKESFKIKK